MATMTRESIRPVSKYGAMYPWVVVGLFWVVVFLNQADRQVIFSVLSLLQRELGLTNTQLGPLGSSFQWGYAALVLAAGGFSANLSRRSLIVLALLVCSRCTARSTRRS